MRLTVNGATKRVKLCTKCLRTAKKEIKAKSAPKIASSAQAAATV